MNITAIALLGLQEAQNQMDRSASRVASASAISGDAINSDTVDISQEAISMMSAKTLFSANLSSLETAGQMQQSILDMMA